jgi:acyl carrier protein
MISVEQIHAIIKQVVPAVDTASMKPDVRLREYGVDSLDFFDIVLELQTLSGHEVPDEDLDQLRTVEAIQRYFANRDASAR